MKQQLSMTCNSQSEKPVILKSLMIHNKPIEKNKLIDFRLKLN